MKKLMTLVLSACLLTGGATLVFAQEKQAPPLPKEDGKGKADKGKEVGKGDIEKSKDDKEDKDKNKQ